MADDDLAAARADQTRVHRICDLCSHEQASHTAWGCGERTDCDCRLSAHLVFLRRQWKRKASA